MKLIVDVLMPMYNMPEYSKKFTKTKRSFWIYYRDELKGFTANNYESFKYKINIRGKIPNSNQENDENTDKSNRKTKNKS